MCREAAALRIYVTPPLNDGCQWITICQCILNRQRAAPEARIACGQCDLRWALSWRLTSSCRSNYYNSRYKLTAHMARLRSVILDFVIANCPWNRSGETMLLLETLKSPDLTGLDASTFISVLVARCRTLRLGLEFSLRISLGRDLQNILRHIIRLS